MAATRCPSTLATALSKLMATLPFAVIRRFPATSIGLHPRRPVPGSLYFGRHCRGRWRAVIGWLIALATCPVLLPQAGSAIGAVAATEVAVILAAHLVSASNVTPWDATAGPRRVAVLAAWGAGEMVTVPKAIGDRAGNSRRASQGT